MVDGARPDPKDPKQWWISCSICDNEFAFNVKDAEDVYRKIQTPQPVKQTAQPVKQTTAKPLQGVHSHYGRCENNKKDGSPCKTVYVIKYDHTRGEVSDFYKSGNSDYDTFWIETGRDLVKGNLDNLDKRAEYMITTITALIVIDFGILVGFQVPALTLKVAPQILFAISIMFFFWSLRIKRYSIQPDSVNDIRSKYNTIGSYKYKWQNAGYYWFVAGLLAMAITYLIDSPLNYLPEKIDTSKIVVDGNLKLNVSQP